MPEIAGYGTVRGCGYERQTAGIPSLDSTLALSEGTHDAKDRRGVGSSAV